MNTLNDETIEVLKERIGMDTATLLVTPDSEERYFIGEALLTAVALLLLNEYCKGIVIGLKIQDAGEEVGKRLRNKLSYVTTKLNNMLVKGAANKVEVEDARNDLQSCIDVLSNQNIPDEVKQACEAKIVDKLVEHGAVDVQAKTAATAITKVLYGDTTK
jgi:3-keto-L-gulonate-6-phosphate decarboxylase